MRNPLNKRLFRELKSDIGKYAVILILMVLSISVVSGFLVSADSMLEAYNNSFSDYNIENGHFTTEKALNKAQRKSIQGLGITLYDLYYADETASDGSTIRIYKIRDEVNRACLMEGELPDSADEIVLDRMYADNNEIQVGDDLTCGDKTYTVTGLVALSDYSALFADNNDSMFDAKTFSVAMVTEDAFEALDTDQLTYCYAFKYLNEPADETEENQVSEDLVDALSDEVKVKTFIPRYLNQAINFTGDDMSSDRGMMSMYLYIMIVVLAFVFGVTISNTISKEAAVIGTLRASGYTRMELVMHYLSMPILITLIGAVIGNILGYTGMKDFCASLYYGSYSLPTYVTIWNATAFIETTVIPIIMMLVINFVILWYKLRLSPLKFIRRDLRSRRQKRALKLNYHIPFFTRFRLRVFGQNISNYVVLYIGVFIANVLLFFGLGLPMVLDKYQEDLQSNLLANYQYILTMPETVDEDHKLESAIAMMRFMSAVETDNEDAEKFSYYSLKTMPGSYMDEEISIYGVEDDSQYVAFDHDADGVYISASFSEKYELQPGDTFTLREVYKSDTYDFKVAGVIDYYGGMNVFLDIDDMNEMFDLGEDYFCGYFSDTEITDIDEEYIGNVLDLEALTKICRQMDISMGEMMYMLDGFSVLVFIVMIYLMSKIIIEKNAQSISMSKILGYSNGEISRLYIISTTIVYMLCLLINMPICSVVLVYAFEVILRTEMAGWLPLKFDNIIYVEMFIIGMASYAVVALLEYRKIQKVPMDEALKNVE